MRGAPHKVLFISAVGILGASACAENPTTLPGLDENIAVFSRWDPCFIYEPCLIDGIWVITRRRPDQPVQWPEGVECGGIPGGCFTPNGVFFGREPWLAPRGTINPPGTEFAADGARPPSGTESRDMQRALTELERRWPKCKPLVQMMKDRIGSGGIWMANRNNGWWLGEWVREEGQRGVVYISYENGGNWTNGTADISRLRRTLTEEAIHAWFDTDVGHGSQATDEQKAAMEQARQDCGKWVN